MTQEQYFIAQSVYRNWALIGLVLFPAMLLNLLFAYMLRGERPAFWFAVRGMRLHGGRRCAVFFTWTYPANVATQNWTVQPANWAELRRQWEYSHAVNAILMFASFCLLAARERCLGAGKRYCAISTCVLVPGPSPVISTITSSSLAPS